MSEIKAILFDVGGVLINFEGLNKVSNFMRNAPDTTDIRSRWIASPAIISFETGKLSKEEFAAQFVEEWDLQITSRQFLELFVAWLIGPLPGVDALLGELQNHFTLACLSNTNELHWEIMLGGCGLREQMHHQYSSHLIGKLKPDPAAFNFVCKDLELNPDQIIFFDDGAENISGAQQFGMQAHKVHGPHEIREKLVELDLLG